jgi:molybdopterin converting factor small subunit
MMTVHVLFFSFAAERMNARELEVDAEPGATIADVFSRWAARLGADQSRFLFAVNDEWQPPEYVLQPGDTLAVIPPVAGG